MEFDFDRSTSWKSFFHKYNRHLMFSIELSVSMDVDKPSTASVTLDGPAVVVVFGLIATLPTWIAVPETRINAIYGTGARALYSKLPTSVAEARLLRHSTAAGHRKGLAPRSATVGVHSEHSHRDAGCALGQ